MKSAISLHQLSPGKVKSLSSVNLVGCSCHFFKHSCGLLLLLLSQLLLLMVLLLLLLLFMVVDMLLLAHAVVAIAAAVHAHVNCAVMVALVVANAAAIF